MQRPALAILFCVTACFGTDHLPPPQAPEQIVPAVDPGGQPAPGLGRVLIDVDGDQATVQQVMGGSIGAVGGGHAFAGALEVSRPLCVTPCKVDLSPGPQALRFVSQTDPDRRGDAFINVDSATTVYRYKLGRSRRPYGRRTLAWITGAIGVFCDVGALATIRNSNVNMPIGYGVTGIVFTGLSWWLFHTSHFVEQAGTGVQWSLPPTH
jgi:hypothetical protein